MRANLVSKQGTRAQGSLKYATLTLLFFGASQPSSITLVWRPRGSASFTPESCVCAGEVALFLGSTALLLIAAPLRGVTGVQWPAENRACLCPASRLAYGQPVAGLLVALVWAECRLSGKEMLFIPVSILKEIRAQDDVNDGCLGLGVAWQEIWQFWITKQVNKNMPIKKG